MSFLGHLYYMSFCVNSFGTRTHQDNKFNCFICFTQIIPVNNLTTCKLCGLELWLFIEMLVYFLCVKRIFFACTRKKVKVESYLNLKRRGIFSRIIIIYGLLNHFKMLINLSKASNYSNAHLIHFLSLTVVTNCILNNLLFYSRSFPIQLRSFAIFAFPQKLSRNLFYERRYRILHSLYLLMMPSF